MRVAERATVTWPDLPMVSRETIVRVLPSAGAGSAHDERAAPMWLTGFT